MVSKIAETFTETVKNVPKHVLVLQKSANKAIESLLRKAWVDQRELRILVTGKTGQGKSTLINGILGAEVAKEGASAKRCTTEVAEYPKVIHGVPIKVFDSPGLQDRMQNEEEYIQSMSGKCKELSLVLYCTKMVNTRLTDDDKHAMKKLTKAFGERFWNYAVFVLTFANMENCSRKDDRDEDVSEPKFDDEKGWHALIKQRFEGRLKLWEKELKQFLTEEVGVNQKIAERIPVVPTGDYKLSYDNRKPLCLPDRDNWFNSFWEACCLRVKETRLFLQVNQDRMVVDDNDNNDDGDDDDDDDKIQTSVRPHRYPIFCQVIF